MIFMKLLSQITFGLVLTGLVGAGCKSTSHTTKGAVIGAGSGAVLGAVVGKAMGKTATGAVVGAAVGGVVGGVIGRKMDKQAEEMKEVLGDAEIRRVGEGIVIEFKEKILFGYDRSDLGTSATNSLTKLSNVLKKYPDTNIEILGHTDDKGSHDYNMSLSERRASSVATFLRNNGIVSSRIKTRGLGETDPKVANDTEDGRAENRRVEFVITANQKMVEDAQKEAGQ